MKLPEKPELNMPEAPKIPSMELPKKPDLNLPGAPKIPTIDQNNLPLDIPKDLKAHDKYLKDEIQNMPKQSEAAAFNNVPTRLIYLGIAISVLSQLTGVPIISHKQCSIYQAPDNKLLRGSLSWESTRPADCFFDGKSWGVINTELP